MLAVGDKVMIVVQGDAGAGIVPARIARVAPTRDPHMSARTARHHVIGPYFASWEGIDWCHDNPEAVRALEAGVALGSCETAGVYDANEGPL